MTKPKAKRAVRNGSEPNPKTALLNKAKEAIANGERSYREAASSLREAAKALAELRDHHDMSQRKLAKEVGKSQPWINRLLRWYERGCKDASPFDLDHDSAKAKNTSESNDRSAANRSTTHHEELTAESCGKQTVRFFEMLIDPTFSFTIEQLAPHACCSESTGPWSLQQLEQIGKRLPYLPKLLAEMKRLRLQQDADIATFQEDTKKQAKANRPAACSYVYSN